MSRSTLHTFATGATQSQLRRSVFGRFHQDHLYGVVQPGPLRSERLDRAAAAVQFDPIDRIGSADDADSFDALVHENPACCGGTLIGKFIGGLTEQNNRVAGYVVSIIRQGNIVSLELDNGWIVPISGVETIIDPSMFDVDDPQNPADDG
jgi:hypothetical protein